MAGVALSSIGVKFGYGLGANLTTPPESWKQIEACVSIGSVERTKEKLDATPLETEDKQYIGGHSDTGGELQTVFNVSDTFDKQWGEMLTAYKGKTTDQVMYFCAYHPNRTNMDIYIVEPGSLPRPEYSVGSVLQYTITNTLIDLPEPIAKVEPTVA